MSPFAIFQKQLFSEETKSLIGESEECLILDPRGDLTPSQMVEQKLIARLGTGRFGVPARSMHGPEDVPIYPRGSGHSILK